MLLLDWFLWFFIYSFIGWAWETALFTVKDKRFVNRGFLNGPFCPVYGFGALLFLLVLNNIHASLLVLFLVAVVLATTLEYLTAVILEKSFHAKWWDYSMFPLNFQGRISLLSSVTFGIMAVLQILFIHPYIRGLTNQIPLNIKHILVVLIIMAGVVDLTLTVRHIFILNGRLSEIQGALNAFLSKHTKRAGELKNAILINFEESEFYSERIKTLFNLDRFQNRRLIRAFPKLKSEKYDDALRKLKDLLARKQ